MTLKSWDRLDEISTQDMEVESVASRNGDSVFLVIKNSDGEILPIISSQELLQDMMSQRNYVPRTAEPTDAEIKGWQNSFVQLGKMNLDEIRNKIKFIYELNV